MRRARGNYANRGDGIGLECNNFSEMSASECCRKCFLRKLIIAFAARIKWELTARFVLIACLLSPMAEIRSCLFFILNCSSRIPSRRQIGFPISTNRFFCIHNSSQVLFINSKSPTPEWNPSENSNYSKSMKTFHVLWLETFKNKVQE